MDVRIGTQTVSLQRTLAEGGEARIYKLDDATVAKVYRLPSEFYGDQNSVLAARLRIMVAQRKLKLFPRNLPANVIAPTGWVRGVDSNLIIGYTMPFVQNACAFADFRETHPRYTDRTLVDLFRSLAQIVRSLHQRGVIIGDFNDQNVLARSDGAFLIDCDSMQYGPFRSKMFTTDFVDPNRCDPNLGTLELIKLHNVESDWYAWWVMLFQSLHHIHPYRGVHRPADKSAKVPAAVRGLPQHRISVYHPEVVYPAQARPLDAVPEMLSSFFRRVFVEGLRPEPPEALFDGLAYKADGSFDCVSSRLVVPTKAVEISRDMKMECIYEAPSGSILAVASSFDEDCVRLEHRNGKLLRNDVPICPMKDAAGLHFTLSGDQTVISQTICRASQCVIMKPGWNPIHVDLQFPTLLAAELSNDVNPQGIPLVTGSKCGTVYYDGSFHLVTGRKEPVQIVLDIDREVFPLRFWVRDNLLFILCTRHGDLGYLLHHLEWDRTLYQSAFSYATPSSVTDARAYFNEQQCWLFLRLSGDRTTCDLLNAQGGVEKHLEVDTNDKTIDWARYIHGKCQVDRFLFSGETAGLTRVDWSAGGLSIKNFTGPVDLSSSWIVPTTGGLYAVNAKRIVRLSN